MGLRRDLLKKGHNYIDFIVTHLIESKKGLDNLLTNTKDSKTKLSFPKFKRIV